MPLRNTHILGVTSLWMAIPIFHGLSRPPADMLAALLAAVCLASTLFWSNPRGDSFLHRADKLLAWTYAAAMMRRTAARPPGDPRVLGLIVASILVFFLLSDAFFRRRMHGLQLSAHLLFRYAFYWWSHVIIIPPEPNFLQGFLVLSAGYFGHALFMYFCMDWRSWPQRGYWISCLALLCWILLCARVHACVSSGAPAT